MSKKPNGLTLKLSVPDRLNLLSILPAKGSVATLRMVEDLRRYIGFPKAEYETIALQQKGDAWSWNNKARDKEYTFSGFNLVLIVTELQRLEKAEQLQLSQLSLWDKFVGDSPARGGK